MTSMAELTDPEWALAEDLVDQPGRRGVPARHARRDIVEAILFLARTGREWRCLPDRCPPWEAVWQQWRGWLHNGVKPKGDVADRSADPREEAPARRADDGDDRRPDGPRRARRPDVPQPGRARRAHHGRVGRDLVSDHLAELPSLSAIVTDRGYRGLAKLAGRDGLTLDIKAPPIGAVGFQPLKPLDIRVEYAFARLGRWRRLSRCYEGTEASARAWLEVACLAYLFTRLRAEPP